VYFALPWTEADRAPAGFLLSDNAPVAGCAALERPTAGSLLMTAGSPIVDPGPTAPFETKAASTDEIDAVDREAFAGTVNCWKAPAGRGSIGLGAREPARPGSATRARAAVSTDPTTNLGGRTRVEE